MSTPIHSWQIGMFVVSAAELCDPLHFADWRDSSTMRFICSNPRIGIYWRVVDSGGFRWIEVCALILRLVTCMKDRKTKSCGGTGTRKWVSDMSRVRPKGRSHGGDPAPTASGPRFHYCSLLDQHAHFIHRLPLSLPLGQRDCARRICVVQSMLTMHGKSLRWFLFYILKRGLSNKMVTLKTW